MAANMSRRTEVAVNTLRQRRNGRHFEDNIFKCIFLNQNVWIPIEISLKSVPKGPINNMAWRRPGDKQFSDAYMRHSASMSKPIQFD